MLEAKWINGYEDLADAHMIRIKVFIDEQGISWEDEMDDKDKDAMHLVLYDDKKPVATGRVLWNNGDFVIGRVAVLKEYRGKKYGDFIMRIMIRKAFECGGTKQFIHAQTAAIGFYEKLGFAAYGDEFMEDGIPHVSMVREGDIFCFCL